MLTSDIVNQGREVDFTIRLNSKEAERLLLGAGLSLAQADKYEAQGEGVLGIGFELEEASQCPCLVVRHGSAEARPLLLHPFLGVASFQVRMVAGTAGCPGAAPAVGGLLRSLLDLFLKKQGIKLEVRCLLQDKEAVLLDVSAFDLDDAIGNDPAVGEILEVRSAQPGREGRAARAIRQGITCVEFGQEGVTLLTNGASAGMLFLDCLAAAGVQPACFMDLGSAAQETLSGGLQIALENPQTKLVLLLTVGGGMTRLDVLAERLLEAQRRSEGVPLFARLVGNFSAQALQGLQEAGLLLQGRPEEVAREVRHRLAQGEVGA